MISQRDEICQSTDPIGVVPDCIERHGAVPNQLVPVGRGFGHVVVIAGHEAVLFAVDAVGLLAVVSKEDPGNRLRTDVAYCISVDRRTGR